MRTRIRHVLGRELRKCSDNVGSYAMRSSKLCLFNLWNFCWVCWLLTLKRFNITFDCTEHPCFHLFIQKIFIVHLYAGKCAAHWINKRMNFSDVFAIMEFTVCWETMKLFWSHKEKLCSTTYYFKDITTYFEVNLEWLVLDSFCKVYLSIQGFWVNMFTYV